MIRALRRAGCSWFDVAANPAVRREASTPSPRGESGGGVAAAAATAATAVRRPVEVAARRAAARSDASFPRSRYATRADRGPMSSTIPRFGSDSRSRARRNRRQGDDRRRASRAARCDARAHARGSRARGGGSGSSGDAIGPRYPDAREEVATFISSAARSVTRDVRGLTWRDTRRFTRAFARASSRGYSVYSPRSCDIRSRRRW